MTRALTLLVLAALCVGVSYLALFRGDRKERP